MNNFIEYTFDDIFNKLTQDSGDLYTCPFHQLVKNTFNNIQIHEIVATSTNHQASHIQKYLTDTAFQTRFLLKKLRNQIYIRLLFEDFDCDLDVDDQCLQIATANNRVEFIKHMIANKKIVITHDMLYLCAKYGYNEIYDMYTQTGIYPNISIYYGAIHGSSLHIIKSVNHHVGISPELVTCAIQIDKSCVASYILQTAISEKIVIDKNASHYSVLNNNLALLDDLDKNNLVIWDSRLYYSALLSGSLLVIKHVEQRIPNIHHLGHADPESITTSTKSPLLNDMIYEKNGKKYYSHTMMYAVESGCLRVVEYIYNLGYRITLSTIIAAIRQSTVSILVYLVERYHTTLPQYILHYFGPQSHASNKMQKLHIVYDKIDHNTLKLKVQDHAINTCHYSMIRETKEILEEQSIDPDFLHNTASLFTHCDSERHHLIISRCRMYLTCNMHDALLELQSNAITTDMQTILEATTLYGTTTDLVRLYSDTLYPDLQPNTAILSLIMRQGHIDKIKFFTKKGLIGADPCYIKLVGIIAESKLTDAMANLIDRSSYYFLLCNKAPVIRNWLSKYSLQDVPESLLPVILENIRIVDSSLLSDSVVQ